MRYNWGMPGPRHAALAAVALAGALLAAGCGGGGAKPAGKPASPDAAALLRGYLVSMRPQEQRFASLSRRLVSVLEGVNTGKPDATWAARGRRLAATSGDFGSLALEIGKVKAPVPLRHVHEQLAEAVDALGTFVFQIQTALQSGIPSLLSSATAADTSRIGKARSDWAVSVERDATRLGVPIPAWLVPSPAE